MTASARHGKWQPVTLYLLLLCLFSGVFFGITLATGREGRGLYTLGGMWSPGFAAVVTTVLLKRDLGALGWSWGETKYALRAVIIPASYATLAYLGIWFSGRGSFGNAAFVARIAEDFGWSRAPYPLTIAGYVLLQTTLGLIVASAFALGEEIGWRGFLTPELAKHMSPRAAAVVTGIVWALWHFPTTQFADVHVRVPLAYGFGCFTVMIVGMSVPMAWLRLRSGSLWTAVLFHASHNVWIQDILTPLTTENETTKFFIDEFGIALALACAATAAIFWRPLKASSGK